MATFTINRESMQGPDPFRNPALAEHVRLFHEVGNTLFDDHTAGYVAREVHQVFKDESRATSVQVTFISSGDKGDTLTLVPHPAGRVRTVRSNIPEVAWD